MTEDAVAERTRTGYDALSAVWAETTDDNLWNEVLDRRPIRSLLPRTLEGVAVLDAGMAAGRIAVDLLDRGADVTGIDLTPAMVETARRRRGGRGRCFFADLGKPLPFEAGFFVRAGGWSSLLIIRTRRFREPIAAPTSRPSYSRTDGARRGSCLKPHSGEGHSRTWSTHSQTLASSSTGCSNRGSPGRTEPAMLRIRRDSKTSPVRAIYRWRKLPTSP